MTSRAQRRHAARLAAVQALYQVEHNDADPETVILEFLQHRHGPVVQEEDGTPVDIDRTHFGDLVRGAMRRQADIDRWLGALLVKGWPLPRLDAVLRAILRCGTYELWARGDVPAKVIINEYLDLAHAFFSGDEPGIVNGVLDRVAHQLRRVDLDGGPHGKNATAG